ncbi:MAG: bifunctional nuclease family protein [Candidatus Sumerlaeota bacterium]
MLIEMELKQILRSAEMAAIVLCEKKEPRREFPVYIDQVQAQALEFAVNGVRTPRPLTHDLVLNVIEGMGGKLRRVIIDKIENATFYGKLDIEQRDHSSTWIDVRPSDAVVVGSKIMVPIFVDEQVLLNVNARPAEDDDFFDDMDLE